VGTHDIRLGNRLELVAELRRGNRHKIDIIDSLQPDQPFKREAPFARNVRAIQ
jgi:hypothetical protein